MIEKEPAKRYQTASALISGLESVRNAAAPGPIHVSRAAPQFTGRQESVRSRS